MSQYRQDKTYEVLDELLEAIDADTTSYRLEASERAKNALAEARELRDKRRIEREVCGCGHRRADHQDDGVSFSCTLCICQAFHDLDEERIQPVGDPRHQICECGHQRQAHNDQGCHYTISSTQMCDCAGFRREPSP